MSASFRVISIGTLSSNTLWNESGEARTGHATTTLIESGDARILVNPSLPAAALAARLSERSPVSVGQITHIFLTSFRPDHRRSLPLFDHAVWLLHEPEREAAGAAMNERLEESRDEDDANLIAVYEGELDLLRRCKVADDSIARGVDLFPLPGSTPGTCGLLLPMPQQTVLICGDAVPTIEHLEQAQVLPDCADREQAQESFREAIEIADVLVLGRDNLVHNPLRSVM